MAMDYKKYLELANKYDYFTAKIGAKLTEIRPGYAKAEMPITQDSFNMSGSMHGGALYTLGDFAAGHAVRAYGKECVTLDCSMNYLRGVSSGKIVAEAKQLRRGKHISFMEVEICDGNGKHLCQSLFTFYMKENDVVLPEKED